MSSTIKRVIARRDRRGKLGQAISSPRFQAIDHMPCKCGGTRWLTLVEPADGGLPQAGQGVLVNDPANHDVRTFECSRCQQTEAMVVRFKLHSLPEWRDFAAVRAQSENRILNAIPQNVFAAAQPHFKGIDLKFGAVVAETGQIVEQVYFPHTGVISLVVVMQEGDLVETAMVGRDGVVNGTSSLDGKISLHKAIVQVAGFATVIPSDALRRLADEFEPLRSLIIGHEQVLLAQAQQSAGCNASHTVEARLCRWLLRIRDLTASDEMELTQEFIAQMLGVRRTSVSLVAGTLQKAGLIQYRRGHITLLDVAELKQCACECYEKVKGNYDRLL
jgi:CRP-like cAMP-binding protein